MQKLALVLGCLLLAGAGAHAQVATTGSTAMSLPTVPGAIVTQPLNTPGPFSASTVSGMADTTLAPVPLASNPATPGTFVTCTTPSSLLIAGVPAPTVTPSTIATAPMITSPAMTTPLTTAIPATTTTTTTSSTSTSSFTIAAGSTTGTVSSSPVGAAQATVCSDIPGGPATPPSVSLSLVTPQVPASPAPGVISPDVTAGGDTSLDQVGMTMAPTPNGSSCAEAAYTNLSNPGAAMAANATGAAATPGVTPVDGNGC